LEILLKIFYIDNDKFADVINETFNTSENLYENIKIFSNFWKSIYDLYPEEKNDQNRNNI
jgi:cell division GTPase FtsZ